MLAQKTFDRRKTHKGSRLLFVNLKKNWKYLNGKSVLDLFPAGLFPSEFSPLGLFPADIFPASSFPR